MSLLVKWIYATIKLLEMCPSCLTSYYEILSRSNFSGDQTQGHTPAMSYQHQCKQHSTKAKYKVKFYDTQYNWLIIAQVKTYPVGANFS
jgi:hypothetical protein